MKPAPTKNDTAKLSTNQRIGIWQQELKYNEKQKSLEVAENTHDEIKNKNRKRSNRIKPLYKFSTFVFYG